MKKARKTAQPRPHLSTWPSLTLMWRRWLSLGGLCLILATGCLNRDRMRNDPLLGGSRIPLPPRVSADKFRERQRTGVALDVPEYSDTNPAALAGKRDDTPPRDKERSDRWWEEGDSEEREGTRTVGAIVDRRGTSGQTSRRSSNGASYLELQEMLKARGVVWQKLQTWGDQGEWLFTCSIPYPDNPHVERRIEGRARGEHGLEAIRAAIKKIDDDRQR